MKVVFGLSFALAVLASTAHARTQVVEEARSVVQELRGVADRLSPEQERKVMIHLRAIRNVVRGGDVGGGFPTDPGHAPSYRCVSRDNDNRAPYVIGIRDGLNVSRIRGSQFASESECQEALASTRYLMGETLICVSRDNDGRNPYQIAKLGTDVVRLPRTLTPDVRSCGELRAKLRPARDGRVLFCNSRDNDNRAPYKAISLRLSDGDVQTGSEIFNTMGECESFVGLR